MKLNRNNKGLDGAEKLTVQYYDENAAWCAALDLPAPFFHQEIVPLLVPREPRFLDVGCGIGRYIDAFRQIGISREHYLGIDPSRGMLEIARSKHPGYDFQEMDIYSLPDHFTCGHFNSFAVIMTLAHVTPMRMLKALDSIRSVLSEGAKGIIVMQDTNQTLRMVNGVLQNHNYQGPSATFAGWRFERLEPKLLESGFVIKRHVPNVDDVNYAVLVETP